MSMPFKHMMKIRQLVLFAFDYVNAGTAGEIQEAHRNAMRVAGNYPPLVAVWSEFCDYLAANPDLNFNLAVSKFRRLIGKRCNYYKRLLGIRS